mgnify:CR=1 FL=1
MQKCWSNRSEKFSIPKKSFKNTIAFGILILTFIFLTNCGFFMKYKQPEPGFQAMTIDSMNYYLYVPDSYFESGENIPFMLFLHGAGERGKDLTKVKTWGPPKIAEENEDFPFLMVAPQCPAEVWWTDDDQIETLQKLVARSLKYYKIDKKRVYLTGLSMGGYGTWKLASQTPETFTAIAPICGGGKPEWGCKLKNIPIWAFHGKKDQVVSVEESKTMVKAVQNCGGEEVRLTIYPETGHDSWKQAYNDENLFDWLLKHRK